MRTAKLVVVIFTAALALMADWKVYVDKKANQITGLRNAHAEIGAKGLSTAVLLIGCNDGKSVLRLVDRFRSFKLMGANGSYYSHVMLRPSAVTQYIDAEVPGAYDSGVAFLILDEKLAELLPKIKADTLLFAQLSYEGKDEVVRFPMNGLDVALTKMAEAGCHPSGA